MTPTTTKPCTTIGCEIIRAPHSTKCRTHTNEEQAAWRARNRESFYVIQRRSTLKCRYGITPEDYDRMWEEQGGVCAICFQPETATTKNGMVKPLSVDHDHETRKVRALLCQRCNTVLAAANDDEVVLEGAIRYLQKHRCR